MPYIQVKDIELHYEVLGQGPPLMMLMGLRGDRTWFYRQVTELSRHFKLILLDNPGAGQSDKPDKPYSIADMAEDTVSLMDQLNLSSAHFLGVSMGGCIAQEVAICFPSRVRGLVLACTTCGGAESVDPPEHIMKWYASPGGMNPHEFLQQSLAVYFSDRWLENENGKVEEFVRIALASSPPAFVFQQHMEALSAFASAKRLSGLTQPTLITTGSDDSLIPAENSVILAGLIPDSSLLVFPQARHCFFIEMAARLNKEITSFLHQVDRA